RTLTLRRGAVGALDVHDLHGNHHHAREAVARRRDQRRLAARRRSSAIGKRFGLTAGTELWRQRPSRAAVLPRDVAWWRHALPLDHLAHLLPIHILRHESFGPRAPVLDKHGSGGDFGARRHARRRSGSPFPRAHPTAPVHPRSYLVVVGNRHVVAPDARHLGVLAPCLSQVPPRVRSPLLGHRLSPGHVYREYSPFVSRD